MKIELTYHYYRRQNTESSVFFDKIAKKVEDSDETSYTVSPISEISLPIEGTESLVSAREKGLLLVPKPTENGEVYHYIVNVMTLIFPVNDNTLWEFRKQVLLGLFGENAVSIKCFDNERLGDAV